MTFTCPTCSYTGPTLDDRCPACPAPRAMVIDGVEAGVAGLSRLGKQQREELNDDIYDVLASGFDTGAAITKYTHAVVDLLEKKGVLSALALAPVGRAAIAYHDRNEQPADADKWHAWDTLAHAVEVYKRTLK